MTIYLRSFFTITLLLLSSISYGESISVHNARVNPTVMGMSVTAAYLSLHNHSDTEIVLTGAKSPISGRVELHGHEMTEGLMRMFKLEDGITVAAGEQADLEPGGTHIMLMELKQSVAAGEEIPLTLIFSDGTEKVISLLTAPPSTETDSDPHSHADHQHHHH